MDKYIYKYYPNNDLSFINLKHNQLFFSYNNEINDPSEFTPFFLFSGDRLVWERFSEWVIFKLNLQDKLIMSLSRDVGKHIYKKIKNKALTIGETQKEVLNSILHIYGSLSDSKLSSINKLLPIFFNKLENFLYSDLNKRLLCSFSETCNNPTMWGHYASGYKGFILVFKLKNGELCLKRNKILPQDFIELLPDEKRMEENKKFLILKNRQVKYLKLRPTYNVFELINHKFFYSEEEDHYDLSANINYNRLKCEDLGLIKYTDWKYEKEVRFILPELDFYIPVEKYNFRLNRDHRNELIPKEYRAIEYSSDHLTGVIFGPLIDAQCRGRVMAALYSNRNINVEDLLLIDAMQYPEKYTFKFGPAENNLNLSAEVFCKMLDKDN